MGAGAERGVGPHSPGGLGASQVGEGTGQGPWLPCKSLALPGVDDLEALKAKNIKQTELVADLREAILRVARHFQCTDPKNCSVVSCRLPPAPRGLRWGLAFPAPL